MVGWSIALVGILLVVVNPMVGIGVFVLGIFVALGSSGGGKTSNEAKALSAVAGLFIGALIVLIGVSAAVGVLGALF